VQLNNYHIHTWTSGPEYTLVTYLDITIYGTSAARCSWIIYIFTYFRRGVRWKVGDGCGGHGHSFFRYTTGIIIGIFLRELPKARAGMEIKPEEPMYIVYIILTATAPLYYIYYYTVYRRSSTSTAVPPPPPPPPRPPPFYAALKVSCRANIVGCVAIGIIALKSKMVSRYTLFVIKILRIHSKIISRFIQTAAAARAHLQH